MAKSAKFDRFEVIDKATQLYWQKGFHATSMRNLQDVIDLRPGSIYAAFGSKEALFKETLQYYSDSGVAKLARFRNQHGSPLQALKQFIRAQVIGSLTQAPSGMCMLAKTVAELTDEHAELLDFARKALQRMEGEFAKVLSDAQKAGELDASKDPKKMAGYVQVQIAGLRTYAKVCNDPQRLEEMIDEMFSHHPF
ncbi:TetR/AcrR family transcriptional regulator [Vibrio sp. WXL103]|uniref:TetR/AcrR family transcriptional regulator n=1 Tax=Vibrio sp. WXL103 TaxID=3450710 RepID=UPI003EC794D7